MSATERRLQRLEARWQAPPPVPPRWAQMLAEQAALRAQLEADPVFAEQWQATWMAACEYCQERGWGGDRLAEALAAVLALDP